MALYFIRHEIDPKDEEAINKACPDIHVSINYEDGVQQVLLNGENVNGLIRTEEVGNMASKTSAYKMVRATLLDLQRDLAKTANILTHFPCPPHMPLRSLRDRRRPFLPTPAFFSLSSIFLLVSFLFLPFLKIFRPFSGQNKSPCPPQNGSRAFFPFITFLAAIPKEKPLYRSTPPRALPCFLWLSVSSESLFSQSFSALSHRYIPSPLFP